MLGVQRLAAGVIVVGAVSAVACHRVAPPLPQPIVGTYPNPVLRRGTVVDEERSALRVGALRVCVREALHDPATDTLAARLTHRISLISSVPITLRLSRRGNPRILFGTEVPRGAAGEPSCALLDAVAGDYDLWVGGDGPIPVTSRRGYVDSLLIVVYSPVSLP